MVNNHWL